MTRLAAACLAACALALTAAAFSAGWQTSAYRFTKPVVVPLQCGGGGGAPRPAMPQ